MKKRRIVNVMLLGVILYSFSSCNSYYYVPDSAAMNQLMDGRQMTRVSGDGFYTAKEKKPKVIRSMHSNEYGRDARTPQPERPTPPRRSDMVRAVERQIPPAPVRNYTSEPPKPQVNENPQTMDRNNRVVMPPVNNNNTPPQNYINSREVTRTTQQSQVYYNHANTPTTPVTAPGSQGVQQYNNNYINSNSDFYNQPAIEPETEVITITANQINGYDQKAKEYASYTQPDQQAIPNKQAIASLRYTFFFKNGAKMIGSLENSPNANKVRIRTVEGNLYETNSSDILKKEIYR